MERGARPRSPGGRSRVIDYLVDAVFNYPAPAESHKIAALDVTDKIRRIDRLGD